MSTHSGIIFSRKKKRLVNNNPYSQQKSNIGNIKKEEQKVNQAEATDQRIVQEGRKEEQKVQGEIIHEERKEEEQVEKETKQLTTNIDAELKSLINEYNRVQKEDPNNSAYLIQLRDRILQLRNEKKKVG